MTRTPHSDEWLSAAACAAHTGLTIRALRLYERHGLIAPRRTGKNWRLYGVAELERLNEVIILKGLGLTLAAIAQLLAGKETNLGALLDLQHAALLRHRQAADSSLALIDALRAKMTTHNRPDFNDLLQLAKDMRVTHMTSDAVAWKRYEQTRPRREATLTGFERDDYLGFYEMPDGAIMEIGCAQNHLTAQLTGQAPIEIYPEARDNFFAKLVPAQFTFDRAPDYTIAALTLHQNGFEQVASRISKALAESYQVALARRIRDKLPQAGSETALAKLIAEAVSGEPDWRWRSEQFRLDVEAQTAGIKTWLAGFGAAQEHRFIGVTSTGWDIYHVTFDKGMLEWRFHLDKNGTLTGEWIRDVPGNKQAAED